MCGIAGYYGFEPLERERIEACLQLMGHRGPDGNGVFRTRTASGQHVDLLHSRLAILDLTHQADQPFHVEGGVLAFNGEIYNYRELRARVPESRRRSTGDTEVLAHLMHQAGVSGLDECEGMWALAWFDVETGQLTLARDRFGEKPLYVLREASGLYFGSEPKFIFALRGTRALVNRQHLRRFLVNGYKSLYKTRETFFEGIVELPAGYVAQLFHPNDYTESPYWTPEFENTDESLSFDVAVKGTRERLIRSMDLRLRSDVPVAFCLSGGIDSNVLAGIAKRELGYDVHGFTIQNSDPRYEEAAMVTASVKALGLEHTVIPVEVGAFLDQLGEQIAYHDAPVLTLTYHAQWRLLQRISEHGYRVSISGTGADELFSGYFDHHNAYLEHVTSRDPARASGALRDWISKVRPIVRNPHLADPRYFVESPLRRDHIYLDADYFSSLLTKPFREPFSELMVANSLLRNRMANELLAESVPVILHEDDMNAMYFSIENRSPYLDRSLFEWSSTIPVGLLVQRGLAKAVLREAGRGLVPDVILDNPRKVGFNAPIEGYLNLSDPAVRKRLLSDSPIFDLVDRAKLTDLLDTRDLPNSRSKFLFSFISAKIFLESQS